MVIGVLGGGQLGRMLALAGYPLGLSFRFYDPANECPASELGPHHCAAWDDLAALEAFASKVDVVTWEFENVPTATVDALSRLVPVRPHRRALERGQDRLEEKEFFVAQGLDVHPFRVASTRTEFEAAVRAIGLPCVAKTRRMGYDGKGQAVLRAASDLDAAWTSLGGHPVLVEQFIPFDAEASIIGVRSEQGDIRTYPLTRNVHRAGILRLSEAPSPAASTELGELAKRHVAAVMNALDYVGVLAIEFFIAGDRLLANEMAPRVHNSGHWTIEGARTSQFENHVRAVAGLPLGDCSLRDGSCVMVNIIGARPDAAALLAVPGLHLHDYAKAAKPGRKIGHATLSPVPEGWDRIPAVQAILA